MVKNGLVIFISGRGSNLEAIINASKNKTIPSKISAVIADRNCTGTDIAKKNKIPFQRAASSRYTGTDTDAFAYSNGGVPSALISLPLRYMHTTVEMVHKNDVENVIKLIYNTLLNIKTGEDFSYFK